MGCHALTCIWCREGDASQYEPFDSGEAARNLCRGHQAEWEGTSVDGLDRMESGEHADMDALGYFDR